MVQMRYFTNQNFGTILFLSVGVYYAFMWVCNILEISWTFATILEMHMSHLYYLTLGLCIGLCFVVDLFIRAFEFNLMTTPSDLLRELASTKAPFETVRARFDAIYQVIQKQIIKESLQRENELEKRREELARLLKEQKVAV
jgi:hypothetical protein